MKNVKTNKKNKKTDKSLSIGKKLLLILLLSCSLVGLGVFTGLAVKDAYSLLFALPSAILAFISLLRLLKDYKTEKTEKTVKWYIDKYIMAFIAVWIVLTIVLIVVGYEENEVVMAFAVLMFPAMSILISPNAVLYALKDSKKWKDIFYGKGNLEKYKDTKDFYWIKAPVAFEKRLYRAIVKEQFLNILTVIAIMVICAVIGLIAILNYDSHSVSPGDLIGAIFYVRARRGTGRMAFILLIVLVFGFPIFAYYVTNAIYKLRIVSTHKYMAYHAIVNNVSDGKMRIDCDGRRYKYDYSTLVGMKPKQINKTPAILIFIPDDVFIFPDECQFKDV